MGCLGRRHISDDGALTLLADEPPPTAVREQGEAAIAAWRASLPRTLLADEPPPAAAIEGGEAAVAEWKASLLAHWMDQLNFSAQHPAGDDPSKWPAPEGMLGPIPPELSPLRIHRVSIPGEGQATADSFAHVCETHNFVKVHRCTGYCLRSLRHPPAGTSRTARHCSKGGFGPEAPLVGHRVRIEGGQKHLGSKGIARSYDPLLLQGVVSGYRVELDGAPRDHTGNVVQVHVNAKYIVHDCNGLGCHENGCAAPLPFGKPRRERAAIEVDLERGIHSIELPREHPRIVQGIRVVTDWWMANDDQRVILCPRAPVDCTAEDLARVARYIASYLTKGNEGSEEYAAAFQQILQGMDDDANVKLAVRRLMIRTCGKDYPRQFVVYALAGNGRTTGCLKHTSCTFERLSLGTRRLDSNGGETATRQNGKDRYCAAIASRSFAGSLYEYLCSAPDGSARVPLISGGQTWPTDPLTEQYAHNMLLLHFCSWSKEADIRVALGGETWLESFAQFRLQGDCPRFVEMEIARATLQHVPSQFGPPRADDADNDEAEEQPAWMELLGHGEYTDDRLSVTFDDWTARGHNHTAPLAATAAYPDLHTAMSWLEQEAEAFTARAERSTLLHLPQENPRHANRMQRAAIALLLHALYCHVNKCATHLGVSHEPRRLLLLGKPGAGKSFVAKVLILLTRMVLNEQGAAAGGAPTGVAAFEAGLKTWHSFLKIPVGSKFSTSFDGLGASGELQQKLAPLFMLLGDELSMSGRTLFGWIAHQTRTGIANGHGNNEPFGGPKLPFVAMSGDFHQLDPVFDSPVYKPGSASANSNYGRQAYLLFEDVILLDEVGPLAALTLALGQPFRYHPHYDLPRPRP